MGHGNRQVGIFSLIFKRKNIGLGYLIPSTESLVGLQLQFGASVSAHGSLQEQGVQTNDKRCVGFSGSSLTPVII